jgi:transaldolase
LKKDPGLKAAGEVLSSEDITWERIADGLRAQQITSLSVIGFSVGISSCQAVLSSDTVYDRSICNWLKQGFYGEQLAIKLVAEDVGEAADQLLPLFKRTKGVDGWALLPASPLLPRETTAMLEAVLALYMEVRRPNVLISIPGLQALSSLIARHIPGPWPRSSSPVWTALNGESRILNSSMLN